MTNQILKAGFTLESEKSQLADMCMKILSDQLFTLRQDYDVQQDTDSTLYRANGHARWASMLKLHEVLVLHCHLSNGRT